MKGGQDCRGPEERPEGRPEEKTGFQYAQGYLRIGMAKGSSAPETRLEAPLEEYSEKIGESFRGVSSLPLHLYLSP